MRDINDILKACSKTDNMDYCQLFDRIKSVLEYCNVNVKELNKIYFRGGNEQVIKEIVEQLQELGINYIDCEQDFRKITFFLVLNTDATFKYDLKTDQQICHLLDILPKIPKCLLVSIIWDLNLDKYFYECLTYTPSWFAIQFIEPVVASIKYLKPYNVLVKVENVVKAIYANICRLDFRVMDIIDKKIIVNKYSDHTMDLLRQFYTPDIEKFSDWSKREFFKYSGFAIKHLLKMVMFCFDCIECPLLQTVEDKYRIYEICKDRSIVNDSKDVGYSDVVGDTLQKIMMALCNSLQYNVMLVTVDVFMHWAEIDLTEELTLQADIGDYAHQVLERMANNKEFEHDVEQKLKFISVRKKTLQETICESNIGSILRNVESETTAKKERQLWLDELIIRPIVLCNEECLETINSNFELIQVNSFVNIMNYVKLSQNNSDCEIKNEEMDDEIIREILIKALTNFNSDQIVELILYKIQCFGENSTVFQGSELEQRCIEFFNKSSEKFDTTSFLMLCFENPAFIWKKFFNEACLSQQQAKNFCSTCIGIRSLSKLYFDNLLDCSFPLKYHEIYYPHFLFEIYECEIVDKEVFFKSFVYKNVVEMLEAQHYVALLTILKVLSMIVYKTQSVPTFGNVTAPVLIMIAQIMDQCRWDLVTYSDLHDEIVRLSIDCVQSTTKSYLPVADERDKQWINNKVKEYRPLTRYYFQKYLLCIDQRTKTFDEFLQTDPLTDKISIEKFLISIYVRCTMKETEWLAKSLLLRPHISDMIILLESLVGELGENAIKNFRHSIINYANIIKKILLPDVENDNEKISNLGLKILQIVSNVPESLYDEIFMSFQGVLLEVFQKLRPISEDLIKNVEKFMSSMANCKGKDIFKEKFQAMSIENLS